MTSLHIPFRRTMLVLAALAASLAVAACGSSTSTSTSKSASSGDSATTSTTTTGHFNRSALVTCLKQHGVTLPSRRAGSGAPPGAGGFFGGGGAPGSGSGGGGFFRNNPKMAAAFRACGGGNFRFRGGAGRFRLSHAKIQQYVTCVRQHGYPEMPNPNFSGKGAVFPASIRSNPKFQSASRACQSILVPARPSGTGGTGTSSQT